MRIPDRPSWPQALTLGLALSGAAGIGGQRLASIDLQDSPTTAARAVARVADNAVLVETLAKLQVSVEKLNDTVQTLSTKVAVIEDRQRRTR